MWKQKTAIENNCQLPEVKKEIFLKVRFYSVVFTISPEGFDVV